jgi:hypothetical protein
MVKLKDLMDDLSLLISEEMPYRKVIHTEMLTHEANDSDCIPPLKASPDLLPQ